MSNVFDHHYQDIRGEKIDRSLSAAKRRDLFRCLELATGRKVIILSAPPKALQRKTGHWLAATDTYFDLHRQFFSSNWDAPKLRIPLSWFFYAIHVLQHTRNGDLILIDNYEIIYVIAARLTRLRRRVQFLLDYEDGKHLIDRSIWRLLSAAAEWVGRPLFRAALVAHPALEDRLKPNIPCELVPGFVTSTVNAVPVARDGIRFLYSGSLDSPRGLDLLLAALPHLPETGWTLAISGAGAMETIVRQTGNQLRWRDKVTFHGSMTEEDYHNLISNCHVGLNCQKSSDPISSVTFPSKIFTYLSAGLLVVSSRASQVEEICGASCVYYDEDNPEAISRTMREVIDDYDGVLQRVDLQFARDRYSIPRTAERLNALLLKARLL